MLSELLWFYWSKLRKQLRGGSYKLIRLIILIITLLGYSYISWMYYYYYYYLVLIQWNVMHNLPKMLAFALPALVTALYSSLNCTLWCTQYIIHFLICFALQFVLFYAMQNRWGSVLWYSTCMILIYMLHHNLCDSPRNMIYSNSMT